MAGWVGDRVNEILDSVTALVEADQIFLAVSYNNRIEKKYCLGLLCMKLMVCFLTS